MFQPNADAVRIVWDYVVGVVGVAAAIVVAWTLFALRRSQQARDQGFGDSLRDHLRRRIAQIDDATRERRLALITLAAGLTCAGGHFRRSIPDRPRPLTVRRNESAVAFLDGPDRRVALPAVVLVGAPPMAAEILAA
jgi:hypothetical protein